MTRARVLFLCTHNSARSQMAEGLLRTMAGDRFEVASAGTEATRVHPLAVRAMAEVGIDLTGHTAKALERFRDEPWACVITVCDDAREACPVFPGATTCLHWSFADPSAARGTDDERLAVFRRTRDEIRARLETWVRGGAISTRLAAAADAAAIAAIYNEGIAERIATFETEPRSVEQIRTQLADKGDRYPTVVVERDGHVVAWAGAGAYRSRPAYAGVAEHSVYVARAARGTGAGRAALEALCRVYAARGFWKLVSRIFPENAASLALHERCGFREVGVYRRHGKLEGEWRDCVIVEKLLDGAAEGPAGSALRRGPPRP
jgi:thioredoxin type arsenate reductase